MTRIFMTGIETGDLAAWDTPTAARWTALTTQKRSGAYSVYHDGGTFPANLVKTLPANITEAYIRFGLYPDSAVGHAPILYIRDSNAANQLTFALHVDTGEFLIWRGGPGGTEIALGGAYVIGAWQCVEIYVKIANAPDGIAQVKVDGVLVIDFAGDTQATAVTNLRSIALGVRWDANNRTLAYYDDIAVNDTAGEVNNSWIGRGGIYPVKPDNPGEYAQLTPVGAGANWQCVDDIPQNADTDYVASGVVDKKDSYRLTDLEQTAGTISAVQWVARARLEDAGAGSLARLFRIAAADYQGADLAIDTTTYKYLQEIVEQKPTEGVSVPWQVADINAMEAGEVVR